MTDEPYVSTGVREFDRLLEPLARRVLEAALGAELTAHLGFPPHRPPRGWTGNLRNGSRVRIARTAVGIVSVSVPRDRQGTFAPQLITMHEDSLDGLDGRVIELYADAMSAPDVAELVAGLYGADVEPDTIERVTEAVLDDVRAWRARRLDPVYPTVLFGPVEAAVENGSVRTRLCDVAVGVDVDGAHRCLGLWRQETREAHYWLAVLDDLRRRGVREIRAVRGLTS